MYRLYALLAVIGLVGSIFLYVREFDVLSNTIEVGRLFVLAILLAVLLAGGILYWLRDRLSPRGKHWPEIISISVAVLVFSPLFISWLNRAGGHDEYQSFEFVSEQPFTVAGYGFLLGEKIRVNSFRLHVREGRTMHRFKYKSQAYYPITKTGETILLPMRKGLFGIRFLELE